MNNQPLLDAAEQIRAEAPTVPGSQPSETKIEPVQYKAAERKEPSPHQVYEQVKEQPYPDVRRDYDVMRMFTGALLLDADTSQRAYDYQQQQLEPLRDVERENALAVKNAQDQALRDWNNRERPSFSESITAMFLLENTLVSPLINMDIPHVPAMPGYNPLEDDVGDYWPIVDQLVKSVHPAQTMIMKQNYDFEKEQRAIIARTSTPMNLVTGVAAGITDPVLLAAIVITGGAALGATTTARFAYGALAATTGAAVAEVLLHGNQQLRTLDESAVNILGSALIDGALGGTFLALRRRGSPEYKEAEAATRDYLRNGGIVSTADDWDQLSVGAAKTFEQEVTMKSFDPKKQPVRWALGALPFFMSKIATPLGRGLSASSNKVRATTANLAETNIQLTGEVGQVAAETLIKVDYRHANAAKLDVYELQKKAMKEQGLTPEQFNAELDFAQRRGDVHENPLVEQAAKRLRQVTQDLWTRAAQQRIPGTFKEVIDPKTGKPTGQVEPLDVQTAISYQSRVYDLKKIDADYSGFLAAVKAGAVEARASNNEKMRLAAEQERARTAPDVDAATVKINESNQLIDTKRDLIKNAETAIKQNKEQIGRLKERDKADPKIDELNARVKQIEKDRKAYAKEIKELQAVRAEAKSAIADIKAKIKEIEDEIKPDYMDYELDAYANSFYQGVANLKEGELHIVKNARPDILKSRIQIKDSFLEPFLEKNWERRLDTHVKALSPRIRLAEKFGNMDGDFEMRAVLSDINGEYAARIQELKENGKIDKANALNRERQKQIQNLEFMRDSLLNRVFESDRNSVTQSIGRSLLNFNSTRLLNGMMLSSIPEVSKMMARFGVPKFNNALLKSLENWRIKDVPRDEAMRIASALYRAQGSRTAQMTDTYDITPTTWLEEGTRKLADMTNYWSGQQGFDSLFKSVAGALSADGFVRMVQRGDVAALKKAGFTDDHIEVIQRETPIKAAEAGGLWEPRMEMWNLELPSRPGYRPRSLKDTYDALIVKDADTLIVQPGIGDRPKFMTSMTGRIIFQFKTFIMGATNRTMIPLVQGSGIDMFKNLAYMNAFSMAGYVAYETGVGREIDWKNKEALINEAMNRGGYMGYATELAQLYRRFAGGQVASRYRGRNDVGAFLGPSFGTATDMWRAFSVQRDESGELITDVDSRVHAWRKLLPFQNHFLIRQGLDKAEGAVSRGFGGTGKFAEGPN